MKKILSVLPLLFMVALIMCDDPGRSVSHSGRYPVFVSVNATPVENATYKLTITAPNMEQIGPDSYASGQTIEIYVPEGLNRQFHLKRYDENNVLIDTGSLFRDIGPGLNEISDETVLINMVSALEKPVISQNPKEKTKYVGESVTFSVTAEGKYLTYQWQKDGENISDATSSTLTIENVELSHGGSYQCVVRNSAGSVTSSPAMLYVVHYKFELEKDNLTIPLLYPQEIPFVFGNNSFSQIQPDPKLAAIIDTNLFWNRPDTFITILPLTLKSPDSDYGDQIDFPEKFTITAIAPDDGEYPVEPTITFFNPFTILQPQYREFGSEIELRIGTISDTLPLGKDLTVEWIKHGSQPETLPVSAPFRVILSDISEVSVSAVVFDAKGRSADPVGTLIEPTVHYPTINIVDHSEEYNIISQDGQFTLDLEAQTMSSVATVDSLFYILTDDTTEVSLGQDGRYTFTYSMADTGTTVLSIYVKDSRGLISKPTTVQLIYHYKLHTVLFDWRYEGPNSTVDTVLVPDAHKILDTPASPERVEYEFAGWYRDTGYQTPWVISENEVREDITLYARWERKKYSVTFDTDSGSAIKSQTVEHGKYVARPETDPQRDGFRFGGWFTTRNLNTEFMFDETAITRDRTVYAKWIRVHSVTYDVNDGRGVGPVSGEPPVDENLYQNSETVTVLSGNALSRTGYRFEGWNTQANGSGIPRKQDEVFTMGSADIILYAQWKPVTYTITYYYNDNRQRVKETTYTIEDTLEIEPNTLTRSDYTFKGWYFDEDLTDSAIIISGRVGDFDLHAGGWRWNRTFTDGDRNVYATVRIGDQIWTVENLRTTSYICGTEISHVEDSAQWINLDNEPAYCFFDNTKKEDLKRKYGALYNGWVVADSNSKSLANDGWRVASEEDWNNLAQYLGGYNVAGHAMKSESGWLWSPGPGQWSGSNGSNESGWAGFPGGYRMKSFFIHNAYARIGYMGFWWSAITDFEEPAAQFVRLESNNSHLNTGLMPINAGLSIRLIRDVDDIHY
ncbi:cell wall/surface repeat-containing protein [Chitinispirillum alkaliphilum]|nr:cell wall/surface repeat-containing protein [Chitinispirillum alkaliphilum]